MSNDNSSPGVEPDLGILLSASMRGFVDLLHTRLSAAGFDDVRPAYGVVFRSLRDGPLTLTALAARLGVSKQATLKVVDEMDQKRLLRRRLDKTDARAKLLELTPRGQRAMAMARAIGTELEAELTTQVGARNLALTKRVLATFVELAGGATELADLRSRALW